MWAIEETQKKVGSLSWNRDHKEDCSEIQEQKKNLKKDSGEKCVVMVCERRALRSADTGPVAKDDKRKACLDCLSSCLWPVEVEAFTGVKHVRVLLTPLLHCSNEELLRRWSGTSD